MKTEGLRTDLVFDTRLLPGKSLQEDYLDSIIIYETKVRPEQEPSEEPEADAEGTEDTPREEGAGAVQEEELPVERRAISLRIPMRSN